ncbi:hypothetical protein PTT_14185 [Pyrenophora teres f. teres 0-1]|uniref:Uncharacterized protein n=1 Tax=Pyrenophora teres f. teres (strain 0-1) TaxID=861557 RepID=E3RXN4_PYRTT|nr:hypothetical protein PTT_14185 [Pyrenophora teres f. teres 0-1]
MPISPNPPRYLPTIAIVAASMIYFPRGTASAQPRRPLTLGDTNTNIGFGKQRNQILIDSYSERSSLEDMERALAGLEKKLLNKKD